MDTPEARHRRYIRRHTLLGGAITLTSVLVSVFATLLQTRHWPAQYQIESLLGAVAVPLVIAPVTVFFVLRMFKHNHLLLLAVERMANFDELTGLHNRREFFRQSNKRLASNKRFAVLLADLDWFKKVNDTYGHAAGDAVLRHVANLLTKTAGHNCLVARLGGEEFSAIFEFETVGDARNQAEAFRRVISETPCIYEGIHIPLSVSIGLAISYEKEGIEKLLQRADTALYRAKDSGRNQTLLAA